MAKVEVNISSSTNSRRQDCSGASAPVRCRRLRARVRPQACPSPGPGSSLRAMRLPLSFALLTAALTLTAGSQAGHVVGPGGFPQIQPAIQAASPCDVVVVQAGTYDAFTQWHGRGADLAYLRVLHLAASTMESTVAAALDDLLARDERFTYEAVKARVSPERPVLPVVTIDAPDLRAYDQLLTAEAS